jgi:hypothetical protein
MRKVCSFLVWGLLSLAAGVTAAETFKDVPVVDTNCSKKVSNAPDATRASVH